MKLITKKRQKEVDKTNINKLIYAIKLMHRKHNPLITEEEKRHYKLMAEDIYYADDIMLSGGLENFWDIISK